jgi:small conductance mechanosensitive channel
MTDSFSRWAQIAGAKGLRLLAILLLAFLFARLLRVLTQKLVEIAKSQSRVAILREQQTRTMAGLLYSAGTALILGVAFLVALPEFGFNIAPVAALAGLASLAVGFGGQYLVRDLINGFFVIFEDQFVVGDVVRISDEVGRVEHLTLRRTVLRNDRGDMVTIPNGQIGKVANLSRDWSQTFVDVTVPAEEGIGRALAVLERVVTEFRADPDWAAALVDGPRVLGVESLALSGTILRTQLRAAANRQDDVARELRRRIKSGFEQERILFGNTQRVDLVGGREQSE